MSQSNQNFLTNSISMNVRNCPVCDSSNYSHIFVPANFDLNKLDSYAFASRKLPEYMHYKLVVCPQCDLLYAPEIPTLTTISQAYHEAAFDSSVEAHYASRTYASFLPNIISQLPDKKGSLDIGTGDGAFLEELLSLGFEDVVGVEPSLAPIKAAKPEVKPLIKQGLFKPEDFKENSFSLITCFQTLEHLYNPLEMCEAAYRLLKPGGAVFFICHNRRALSAQILRTKSPIFDIEHLQLFSPKSSLYMLQKAGFKNIQLKRVYNHYPLFYWFKLLPLPNKLKTPSLKVLKDLKIGFVPIVLPAGNIAVIGFK